MAALLMGGLWTVPAPAAAQGGSATNASPLTLVSQSAWVGSGSVYHLGLRVTSAGGDVRPQMDDRLQLTVWSRLTTRNAFDASLSGRLSGNQIYATEVLTLAQLAVNPSGALNIGLPVNAPGHSPGIPTFEARANGGGVYPLQVRLFDSNGVPIGAALTTYLVYAPAATGLPSLPVALTLGVHAPVSLGPDAHPTHLPAAESRALAQVASALGAAVDVPVTLDLTPQTMEALAGGSPTDRATATALSRATATDQLLPAAYVPLSPGVSEAPGLGGEVAAQFSAGTATLAATVGRPADPGTRVTRDPLDPSSLAALIASGVTRLVVPDHDLTPPPAAYQQSTFARPALLATRAGQSEPSGLTVVGADDGLAVHFVGGSDQVLAANHLLAELSMIQLETPGERRGVAVLPPARWQPDPTFVSTVLNGLRQNPLLTPVTVNRLFDTVPLARFADAPVVRSLVASHPPAADPAAVEGWRAGRQQLDGLRSLVPSGGALADQLAHQLLISESADLDARQRQAVLATVTRPIRELERRITLPGPSSITLTARTGNVPLTVLSTPALAARVQLRLSSQKLTFHPFGGPWGQCVSPTPPTLVCNLTLTSRSTTLEVPVETRTSGVFPLVVSMTSPDGSVVLATNRDTVRSTVFSGVGVFLIVAAGLSLAFWWIRNARHGRRARQLVKPPAELADEEPGSPSTSPAPALHAPVAAPASVPPAVEAVPPEDVGLLGAAGEPGDPVSPSVSRHGPN